MEKILNRKFLNKIWEIQVSTVTEIVVIVGLVIGFVMVSQIRIYIYAVPFTLQNVYVALVCLIYSGKTSERYLYIYAGLAFVNKHIFTGKGSDIISFGFVIGFIAMAYIINILINKTSSYNTINVGIILIFSNVILYCFGIGWMLILDYEFALVTMLPFFVFDVFKMIIVIIMYGIKKEYDKRRDVMTKIYND